MFFCHIHENTDAEYWPLITGHSAHGTNIAKMLGLPTSTTDGNRTQTTAEHDSLGRIAKSKLESAVDLRYTYNKGMPDSLTRTADGKAQTYAFKYHAFGNKTLAKEGNDSVPALFACIKIAWKRLKQIPRRF